LKYYKAFALAAFYLQYGRGLLFVATPCKFYCKHLKPHLPVCKPGKNLPNCWPGKPVKSTTAVGKTNGCIIWGGYLEIGVWQVQCGCRL